MITQSPNFLILFSALFFCASSQVHAKYGNSGNESKAAIANGSGQTDPSYYGGIMSTNQNSASLIYNTGINAVTEIKAIDSDFDPLGIGIGVIVGEDGKYAVGAGYLTSTLDDSNDLLTLGVAASLGRAIAVGLQGIYSIDESSFDGNFSLLLNPMGPLRIGANIYSFNNGFDSLGLGIGYDLTRMFTITTDLTGDENFENLILTPGIRFSGGSFSAAAGYALGLGEGKGTGGFANNLAQPVQADDFFASIGLWFKEKVNLNFSYQYGAKYVLGLTFRF